jgi:hypothetical protein
VLGRSLQGYVQHLWKRYIVLSFNDIIGLPIGSELTYVMMALLVFLVSFHPMLVLGTQALMLQSLEAI